MFLPSGLVVGWLGGIWLLAKEKKEKKVVVSFA